MSEQDKEDHIKQVMVELAQLPGAKFTEQEVRAHLDVPDVVRLGDNPYFQAFEKERKEKLGK